jgi:hypothetical protein
MNEKSIIAYLHITRFKTQTHSTSQCIIQTHSSELNPAPHNLYTAFRVNIQTSGKPGCLQLRCGFKLFLCELLSSTMGVGGLGFGELLFGLELGPWVPCWFTKEPRSVTSDLHTFRPCPRALRAITRSTMM